MVPDLLWRHRTTVCFLTLTLGLAAPPALANTEADAPPPSIQVVLSGYALAPELADDGAPVLDDAGQPVIRRVPLEDSVITPGDQILYVINLQNPTEDPALDLTLTVQVAAEVRLDPYSLTGPVGLIVEWDDADPETGFQDIFVEIAGETVMQADLDELRALRLTLPELPPSDAFSVEYTVTLR
jgi:uncharacterized repeat protein (TIGR01451 family)